MRIICCTLLSFIAGCATYKPSDKLEAANSSIQAAEQAGAQSVRPASYHVERAKEETRYAKEQMRWGNRKGASSTLDRVPADTDLAAQLVREERSHLATRQLSEKLNQMKQK
jgi:hypothetical protein